MSNFKIVCGINPKDETIIHLDKLIEISLDREYLENSNCVRLFSESGENWNFETDLKELSDVLCCVEFAFNGRIDFTQRTADFHNNSRNIEFEYAKQKGEALARGIRL